MQTTYQTLREKVFSIICTTARVIHKEGDIKRFFEKYPVGGLYFSKAEGARDLAPMMEGGAASDGKHDYRAYLEECRKASGGKLLICADGANIDEDGKPGVPMMAVGATRDKDLAYRVGRSLGMQMNYNGIDLILGPCIDMSMNRVADTISGCMTDDPMLNGELFSAMVRGIQDEGVGATVKHFPGLCSHHVNFHFGPGQNVLSFNEWMGTYGYSYLACFEADAQCVMTSHLTFRAYSEEALPGRYPICTYSPKLTQELLKQKLGFKGFVVTDALCMGGLAGGSAVQDAVDAFRAGADFLLWPPMEAGEEIVRLIESGEIPMSRLDDAVARMDRFRTFLADKRKTPHPVDKKFVDDTFTEVRQRAIACIRNDAGLLPLSPEKTKKILVIGNAAKEAELEKLSHFCHYLNKEGFEAHYQSYLLTCWEDEIRKICEGYDLIIHLINAPFTVGPVDNCASTCWAFHLVEKEKRMIVNFSSPYFADDYFPEDHTVVTAHQNANEDSFAAVVDRLIGRKPFTGISPVKLHN